ncbi:MAG: hypothetical protein CBB68_07250 [Rhodospirillaceae bacterium TMED8]|nr:hypothetical protein [Magnetovibrio sp.]OUT50787.1 MAG: hypothetical protein CBB68_07250 [Rhodospirillaceae bacterium TMED8]
MSSISLSRPNSRKKIHTRTIECNGYQREDGFWNIEGVITDTKTYSFDNNDREGIMSGESIHNMSVRLTIDNGMTVIDAEAITTAWPYHLCKRAAPSAKILKGLKVGPGWRKAVSKAIGRTKGCTHIRDLIMGPVAQTAYQTIVPMQTIIEARVKATKPKNWRPAVLGTCFAHDSDGPVVKRIWPEFFTHKLTDEDK